jgi:ABC-type nitrate/sulfonate/bicarbonate transport system substrate-binding protein
VLTTTRKELEAEPKLVEGMVKATTEGYEFTEENSAKALDDLLAANPSLEKDDTEAQLKVLLPALHPDPFKESVLKEWSTWANSHGLLPKPLDVKSAFNLG